jgi:phosphomannomutase
MAHPLSLKIGPSGVRGVIGESLTPQLVTSFAAAFGTYCGAGPIVIGTDSRPSGEMLKHAAIAGLLSVGCAPIDVGVVSVPTLMLHVREAGAVGGVSVSGGHGSADWNALRFIGSGGLALRANQAAELADLYHQGAFPRVGARGMLEARADPTAVGRHVRAITSAVDGDRIRAERFTVAVDAKSGSTLATTRRVLEALGCELVAVSAESGGSYRDRPELADEDLAELGHLVRRSGAAAGFAQDADGDRLAVVDERGAPLGADAAVALVAQRWFARTPGPVVVNVAASRAVDDVAARFGCTVHRTRVGEAFVLEAMHDHGAEVGGEAGGGVIVAPVNPCRDSFAAAAVILEAMAVSGESIGALRGRIPRYAMVTERLLCPARDVAPSLRLIKGLFRGERLDATDGVKVMWPDRWLLARPATSEPVIRLAAEAPTDAEARVLINRVLEVLSPGA